LRFSISRKVIQQYGVVEHISNLRNKRLSGLGNFPQPSCAQPGRGRDWATIQVTSVKLAEMSGDPSVMLKRSGLAERILQVFHPDPAGFIRIFNDAERPNRKESTGQILQNARLICFNFTLPVMGITAVFTRADADDFQND
jgi:hypothetical protein